MITPVVKERRVMNSDNKNDRKVHVTMKCIIKGTLDFYRILRKSGWQSSLRRCVQDFGLCYTI